MVLLQHKLNLKVTQKQILTPGLVQMVSVLALNKLELREMINTEMVENPVLEELDSSVPLLDEVAGREEAQEHSETKEKEEADPAPADEKKDSFEEIDFGSFFRDYLDTGYRNSADLEEIERPSFENFLSKPATLTDHLMWQLGAISVRPEVHAAAELIIGNLNEDGYLTASEDELLGLAKAGMQDNPSVAAELSAAGNVADAAAQEFGDGTSPLQLVVSHTPSPAALDSEKNAKSSPILQFSRDDLREAIQVVRQFDPVGVASRDLRECLLTQLEHLLKTRELEGSDDPENDQVVEDALKIVEGQLHLLQNKHYKEIAKAISRPMDAVIQAHEFIR